MEVAQQNNYVNSYHQVKAIAIFGLILTHVLTFTNQVKQINLLSINNFRWLEFFSFMHSHFQIVAGASFFVALIPFLKKGRISSPSFSVVGDYLVALMLLDALKAWLVYGTLSHYLNWDFLKTLFLAYIGIYLLSRIHLVLPALFAILLVYFFYPLSQFFFHLGQSHYFMMPSASPFWIYLQQAIIFLAFWFFIARKSRITQRSRVTQGLVTLVFMASCWFLYYDFQTQMLLYDDRLFPFRWMFWGLSGNPVTFNVLMPFLAWGPTVIFGFGLAALAYYLKQWINDYVLAGVALVSLLIAVWVTQIYFQVEYFANTIDVWTVLTTQVADRNTELMKLSWFLVTLYVFYLCNRYNLFSHRLLKIFEKISVGTFFIYVFATSVSRLLSVHLSNYLSFGWTAVINILVTCAIGYLIAEVCYFFHHKRITFRFKKA